MTLETDGVCPIRGLPGIMTLGYVSAFSETLALAVVTRRMPPVPPGIDVGMCWGYKLGFGGESNEKYGGFTWFAWFDQQEMVI